MSLLLTPREEILWLAALLEGEGRFTFNGRYPNIVLSMTDEDTVRLAHRRAGVGTVNAYKSKVKHHKPFWVWKVAHRSHVYSLCRAVLPYMSERRSKAISRIFAEEKPAPDPIWVRLDRWDR